MDLLQAAIIFTVSLMDKTNHGFPYDKQMVTDVADAVVSVTQVPYEVETLLKISRWESGGFNKDVATCKVKGDHGKALGLFQVHPWNMQEQKDLCDVFPKQAKVALRRVRESKRMCSRMGLKGSDLLTGYTRGHCYKGGKAAKLRWGNGKLIVKIMNEE